MFASNVTDNHKTNTTPTNLLGLPFESKRGCTNLLDENFSSLALKTPSPIVKTKTIEPRCLEFLDDEEEIVELDSTSAPRKIVIHRNTVARSNQHAARNSAIAVCSSDSSESNSTDDSATVDSVTDGSATDDSVTDGSATDDSVTDGSVTDDSATDDSVTDGSATDDSVTDGSVTDGSSKSTGNLLTRTEATSVPRRKGRRFSSEELSSDEAQKKSSYRYREPTPYPFAVENQPFNTNKAPDPFALLEKKKPEEDDNATSESERPLPTNTQKARLERKNPRQERAENFEKFVLHEPALANQDVLDVIKKLVKLGKLLIPKENDEEMKELLEGSNTGRASVTCPGCPLICMRDWSIFFIKTLGHAELLECFSNHGVTFGTGRCVHKEGGRTLVCFMSKAGVCPFPNCAKFDTNSCGPLFNNPLPDNSENEDDDATTKKRKLERKRRAERNSKKREEDIAKKKKEKGGNDEESAIDEEGKESDSDESVDGKVEGRGQKIREKVMFAMFYANGVPNTTMLGPLYQLPVNKNTLTEWRRGMEETLAAAHVLRMKAYEGKVTQAQFDEFAISGGKYGRGRNTSANGQLWFQSLVVLLGSAGGKQKVAKFFVRFVANRTRETLVPWMVSMLADGAVVTTDCWGAYSTLEEEALKMGKQITHHFVNHKKQFQNFRGLTTNAVEGMHHHTRMFLATLGMSGTCAWDRMVRVLAAAELNNIASDEFKKPTRINRFQRLLESVTDVVNFGVPPETVLETVAFGGEVTDIVRVTDPPASVFGAATPSRRSRFNLTTSEGTPIFGSTGKRSRSARRAERNECFEARREEQMEEARAKSGSNRKLLRLQRKEEKIAKKISKAKTDAIKFSRVVDDANNNQYQNQQYLKKLEDQAQEVAALRKAEMEKVEERQEKKKRNKKK